MGFGKKKEDAAVMLGRLKAMPWEQEPLTEIQPLRDNAVASNFDDRSAVQDTK
jgi:hypothetical protein